MIEAGEGSSLLLKPAQAFRVERKIARQDFDGHFAPQPAIASEKDLPHPALSNEASNFEPAHFASCDHALAV